MNNVPVTGVACSVGRVSQIQLARIMTITHKRTCFHRPISYTFRLAIPHPARKLMSHLSQALSPGIRVLIADADGMSARLIAEGLMRGRNEIVVGAVSSSSDDAIRELEKSQPDIALINAHL